MRIASAAASRAQTPRARGNSAVPWAREKPLHIHPLPASAQLSIPTSIAIDLLLRDTKSWSACKRAQKYSCASRGRASLSASPPLSTSLPVGRFRTLPRTEWPAQQQRPASGLRNEVSVWRASSAAPGHARGRPQGETKRVLGASFGRRRMVTVENGERCHRPRAAQVASPR